MQGAPTQGRRHCHVIHSIRAVQPQKETISGLDEKILPVTDEKDLEAEIMESEEALTSIYTSRHTVVCRAAQEAGVPPKSILTGRKKTQFSHLCSSVIPYPIGTKFAREVPASKGSLHTKFEENRSSHFRDTSDQNFVLISSFFSSTSFRTFCKICHKT